MIWEITRLGNQDFPFKKELTKSVTDKGGSNQQQKPHAEALKMYKCIS